MDLTSLSFLLLMVLLTGAMAWAGDTIGRVLGKKRVKLFGLRPKHTAALLTAGAGALGATLAILVLMALAEPVRVWILSGNQVRAELAATQGQLKNVQSELDSKTNLVAQVEGQVKVGQKQLEEGRKKLSAEQQKLAEANRRNQGLLADSRNLQGKIGEQQTRVARLTGQVQTSQTDLRRVRDDLKKEQANATSIKQDNAQVAKRNLELTMANGQLEQQRDQLVALRNELQKERDDLKESIDRLLKGFEESTRIQKEDLQKAQDQLEEANSALLTAQNEIGAVENDLDRLRRERAALVNFGTAARSLPMTYAIRDEMIRVPVGVGLTQAQATSLVTGAIQKASERAQGRGAGVSASEGSAVGFIDLPRPNSSAVVTAAQQRAQLVLELSGSTEPRVLILRSLVNTFQGEFVPLEVVVYRNPVVYKPGDVVTELRIDGREAEDSIAARVAAFIERDLTPKVLRDGLIPAQGSPQPLGEISRDTMIRLVQAIRSRLSLVRVQFISASETRAGDPLRLDFRLR